MGPLGQMCLLRGEGFVPSFGDPFRSVRSCLIPTRPRLASFAPWGGGLLDGSTET